MDELSLWRQKILQILHDPPAKPYEMLPGKKGQVRGGHQKIAKANAAILTGVPIKYFKGLPDYATAGADRPIVGPPQGQGKRIQIQWPKNPVSTHPLSPEYRLLLKIGGIDDYTAGVNRRENFTEAADQAVKELNEIFSDDDTTPNIWKSTDQLKHRFLSIWRKLRHMLVDPTLSDDPVFRNLWQCMPADSRCPDHTIWEHNRLTSALAFMTNTKGDEASRAPWMFRFEIGPVDAFIEESRTSRDLWMGSFLLADLTFHAMLPLIHRYGPDSIIYPDLCGNPRADVWLKEKKPDVLPDDIENPSTYAAVLPNVFTAVVPFGGTGELPTLKDLAKEAQDAMKKRWQKLAGFVEKWIHDIQVQKSCDSVKWKEIWKKQQESVLFSVWSAVRWSEMEKVTHPESLTAYNPLPCQGDKKLRVSKKNLLQDQEAIMCREKRLKPFVPPNIWAHYNHAKAVFARTHLSMHQLERGFDYALTHHQLKMRHALRKQNSPEQPIQDEGGEKCTLCGKRQAIYNQDVYPDNLHGHRRAAREFWKDREDNRRKCLNPDPVQQERLCGVCSVKRFSVEAGIGKTRELDGINAVWAGYGTSVKDLHFEDDTPRVPFPSTATVASQKYLEAICKEPGMQQCMNDVVDAWEDTNLPYTGFARTLNRLAALGKSRTVRKFLMLDTQMSLFPETLDIVIRRAEEEKGIIKADGSIRADGSAKVGESIGEFKARQLRALQSGVKKFRNEADKLKIQAPCTRIAVIRMDGDNMGKLLLGDPDTIQTTWKDVIHPDLTRSSSGGTTLLNHDVTVKAGWPALLNAKRLMGPSLHAFISRALALFSHRIVPWVVEREFSGRLIYCGGDDILIMAPADEALQMTARLQQLFSAPFIIDTMPKETPWGWRRTSTVPDHDIASARKRFVVPVKPQRGDDGMGCTILPLSPVQENLEPYPLEKEHYMPEKSAMENGEILAMLGKGCSLSAGIAYGHFKSPLQGLLRQSKLMINTWAKEYAQRSALGLSHFSRNGIKTRFAMKWKEEEKEGRVKGFASNCDKFRNVVEGFKNGTIPKRLPYKLYEHHQLISDVLEGKNMDEKSYDIFIKGLFMKEAGDLNKGTTEKEDAFFLWKQGLKLNKKTEGEDHDVSVDGLLLARLLSDGKGEA